MMRAGLATWASDRQLRASSRSRPLRFETVASLFAAVALAAIAVPVAIEQTTDGLASASASGNHPASSAYAPAGGEMMFAGYSGVPYTYPSDVSIKKSGVHDFTAKNVEWEGKPFVNPIYYGARIVRWLGNGRTGAMVDFTHSKTIAKLAEEVEFTGTLNGAPAPERATLRSIFKKLEASHGHNMLTLNGLMRLPSLGLRLHPYVGLGAGVSLPHSEVELANADKRTYEYQTAGLVGQALFGIELRTARVSYFIEYKFTYAPYEMPLSERDGSILFFDLWRQFKDWLSGEEPPGGRLTTNLASHQVVGGIGIRTAPASSAP
jgi:lipid A oxidase